jgi:hypothetical protein
MPLYSILDENGFIMYCENHAECPINGTPLLNTEFIKPHLVNGVLVEGATSEEIAQVQSEKTEQLKQQQYTELLATDWYVVRFAERGIPIPTEILEQRQAIREKYK